VTVVLTKDLRGRPEEEVLRRALYIYGLNPRRWEVEPPEAEAAALAWLARASVRVDDLAKPAMIRRALDACALKLDGKPAAARTVARKRAVLYNAVGYALECEFLSTNPIDEIDWEPPDVAEAIDRRVVPNPVQVAAILAKLREFGAPGPRLVALLRLHLLHGRPAVRGRLPQGRRLRLNATTLPRLGEPNTSHPWPGPARTLRRSAGPVGGAGRPAAADRRPGDRVVAILAIWRKSTVSSVMQITATITESGC
jgi:hypothetical protein